MRHIKKTLFLSFITILIFLTTVLTGCSGNEPDQQAPGSEATVTENEPLPETAESKSDDENQPKEIEDPGLTPHIELEECKTLKETTSEKPELLLQTGHDDMINAIAFSPDSRYIASDAFDRAIRLWYPETMELVRVFEPHLRSEAIQFDSTGNFLVSAESKDQVKIWSVQTGELVHEFNFEGRILSVAISPDNKLIAAANNKQKINIWSFQSFELLQSFDTEYMPMAIFFTPDSEKLIYGTFDGTVNERTIKTRTTKPVISLYKSGTMAYDYCPKRNWIAVTASSKRKGELAYIVDVDSGDIVKEIEAGKDSLAIRFDAECTNIVVGDMARVITNIGIGTDRKIQKYRSDVAGADSLAVSPDNKWVASGDFDSEVSIWNYESGELISRSDGQSIKDVTSVAFAGTEKEFLTASKDSRIRKWSLDGNFLADSIPTDSNEWVYEPVMRASKSGSFFVARSYYHKRPAKIWDSSTDRVSHKIKGYIYNVDDIAISPDDKLVATGGCSAYGIDNCKYFNFHLFSVERGKNVVDFKVETNDVTSLLFNYNGSKVIVSGCRGRRSNTGYRCVDPFIDIYNTEDGSLIKSIPVEHSFIDHLATSTIDDVVLSHGCEDSSEKWTCSNHILNFWSLETGELLRSVKNTEIPRETFVFSSDGKYLFIRNKGTVEIRDSETLSHIKTLSAKDVFIDDFTFSPNGKYMLTGGAKGHVGLWDVDSGRLLMSLYTFKDDEWIVIDGEGNIDRSEYADMHYRWRIDNCLYLPEEFDDLFMKPGLVQSLVE